jgi:hypothetical protein
MTEAELRQKYEAAYRIIRSERRMRDQVFRDNPAKRAAKLREIDALMLILTELKDALKPHCEPSSEQGALLDLPAKGDYP